ncbi:MAG: 7-cyano-7-deazaguanine synthase QueC [Planctomycetota bacterium]
MTKKAVVLLSGGLDSATAAASALNSGFDVFTLSIEYGQRHSCELKAAESLALSLSGNQHKVISVDMGSIGGSALTDSIAVPKGRNQTAGSSCIPVTYVPARNTVFLSLALSYAEVINAYDIFIGVTAVDYSGYPDCRQEFIRKFQDLASFATKAGVEGSKYCIHTPLINLSKKEIIKLGLSLGVDYSRTHSCYDPNEEGLACGECDSCIIRLGAFRELGIADPVKYQK